MQPLKAFFYLGNRTSVNDINSKFYWNAFKANARYIVTEDHHYDILKQTPFPYIDVVGIDEFIKVLHEI